MYKLIIFLMTSVFATGAVAASELTTIGALTCVTQEYEAKANCDLFQAEDFYLCTEKEGPRMIDSSYVVAPKACIDDPMLCEGGPLHDSLTLLRNTPKSKTKILLNDTLTILTKLNGAVARSGIASYRELESNARVNDLPGTEMSTSIELQSGDLIYQAICHSFIVTDETVKKYSETKLKALLKDHFFKN